jgi:hypothetical protein
MVMDWMCFGKKIRQIEFARSPSHFEHAKFDLITNPMIPHVNRFGSFHSESVVCDTNEPHKTIFVHDE